MTTGALDGGVAVHVRQLPEAEPGNRKVEFYQEEQEASMVSTKIAHNIRYTGIKKFKPLAESRHLPTREVIDEISVVSCLVRPF